MVQKTRPANDLANMVVLVDDDPNLRETVGFILEAEGSQVETASHGVEGLDAVRRCKPKVAILDVMMPRMDGYEVCKAVREDPELASMFIMMITALGEESAKAKAMQVGADLFMTKPYDHEIILQVIQDIFAGRLVSHQRSRIDGPVVHYHCTLTRGSSSAFDKPQE